MAQAYISAMEHSQWHCRKVLRKRAQRRPLGRLEAQFDFQPRQPVLSSRTVDIDMCGTRTYRAKSTGDIIDEQHQLIHQVYSKARNISSAQPQRSPPEETIPVDQVKIMSLRFLSVDGACRVRPASSPNPRPGINMWSRPAPVRRRPHTSDPRKHVVDEGRTEKNSEVEALTAYRQLQDKIQQQWQDSHHQLDQSQVLRGREQAADMRPSTAWLSFTAGQEGEQGGLVEAFAGDLKYNNEFYTVDGTTGIQVARQLRAGDRIRIGINGKVSENVDAEYSENSQAELSSQADCSMSVPLCWKDQLAVKDAKVVQAMDPLPKTHTEILCESQPVVFKKLLCADTSTEPGFRTSSAAGEPSYRVKSRSRKRLGVDGAESSSVITALSIDRQSDMDKLDQLSLDELVKQQLSQQSVHLDDDAAITSVSISNMEATSEGEQLGEVCADPGPNLPQPVPQPSAGDHRPSIPSRPHSSEWGDLMITNSNICSASELYESRAGRAASAKRLSPVKSSLHKSAAAQGASIGGGDRGDRHYIKITQPYLVRDSSPGGAMPSSMSQCHGDPIHSVSEHNQLHVEDPPAEKTEAFYSDQQDILPTYTPPHSPDICYSFNIPTAESMASELGDSQLDLTDIHGKHLGLTSEVTATTDQQ